MKNSSVLKIAGLLFAAILIINTAGCSGNIKEKTILIQETPAPKEVDKSFELDKLIKIEGRGTIKGWISENELLTVSVTHPEDKDEVGRYKWLELRNVNYGSLEYKKILEDRFWEIYLSPDGSKAAYLRLDGTKGTFGLIDFYNRVTTIGTYDSPGKFSWSSNSRYFSSIVKEGILIYDTERSELKTLNIPNLRTISGVGDVRVSDDGKHAFVSLEDGLFLIDIFNYPKTKADMEKNRVPNGGQSSFAFINNSEAMFVGSKGELGALYQYDLNSKETKEIMENVASFNIALNKKSIAYTSSSTLYVANLINNKLTNPIVIFKGLTGSGFWWNKDNKKFVFQGREQGSSGLKQYVAELK